MKTRAASVMLMLVTLLAGCPNEEEEKDVEFQVHIHDSNQIGQSFEIERLALGQYQTNCYILRPTENKGKCIVVDTSLDDIEPLMHHLDMEGLQPESVICTHGHGDHVNGIAQLHARYPEMDVYIHKDDMHSVQGKIIAKAIRVIEKDGTITPLGIQLRIMHISGHSPGSICLYSKEEQTVLVGDVLFKEGVGKASDKDMRNQIAGIREKLLVLPDQTVVCPGHGSETTIGHEKQNNPFLRLQ